MLDEEIVVFERPAVYEYRVIRARPFPVEHTLGRVELQALDANPAYEAIFRLSSIGQSVQGRELWMAKISDAPDVEEDEPELLYIAAMHGNEVVGKELSIGLIRHLCENYGLDPRVTDLVNETEIWINPLANPDGAYRGGDDTLADAIRSYTTAGGADSFVNPNRNFPDPDAGPPPSLAGDPGLPFAVTAVGQSQPKSSSPTGSQ